MFWYQVSNHVNASTSEPAQILVVLTKKSFVDVATILRKLAQTDISARHGKFTDAIDCADEEVLYVRAKLILIRSLEKVYYQILKMI